MNTAGKEFADISLVITAIKSSSTNNRPVFVRPDPNQLDENHIINLPETAKGGEVVVWLSASDPDTATALFTYSMEKSEATTKELFEVIGTTVKVKSDVFEGTFDYEKIGATLKYPIILEVSDGALTSSVSTNIFVVDVNDNAPVFEAISDVTVYESNVEGNIVVQVKATDADGTDENNQIKFSMTGSTDFSINETTGEIVIASGVTLNYYIKSAYTLKITATDNAPGGALSSTVAISINVITAKCSMLTDKNGIWPATEAEDLATIACEKFYVGNYSRMCSANGEWGIVFDQCEIQETVLKEIHEQLNLISNFSEDVSNNIEDILEVLARVTDYDVDGNVIENVTVILRDIVSVVENTKNVTDNNTQYFFETVSNLMKPDNEEAWSKAGVEGSEMLDIVDKYMALLQEITCSSLNTGEVNQIEKNHLYTEIGRQSGNIVFPSIKQTGAVIDIPESTLRNTGIMNVCFGGAYYNSLGGIMEQQVTDEGTVELFASGEVNSDIIAVQLHTEPSMSFHDLNPSIHITLTLKNENYADPVCVFWDYNISIKLGRKGAWSSEGCVLEEITNLTASCACNHLTNFAILMSPSKISAKHSMILGIISAVGCAVSMLCLLLTIIAHWMVWGVVRSNRTITLMHLCVALLLAFSVFLVGVNRTESRVACVIIAALIQFLFLTVFFLMLVIGMEILLSVVHVFGSRFRISKFLPVAWLAPIVIVGVSLGVTKTEGYGNDSFCWLDIDSGLIWSFIGPAAFVIFVNVIIIVVVFKKMASATFVKSKTSRVKIKTWLHSLCVLLPMLGITWLFGLLSVNSDMFILQYMFSIFSSLQGLFIFLFHCIFNRQIRQALKHRKERRRTLATFSSELKNTTKDRHSQSLDQSQK